MKHYLLYAHGGAYNHGSEASVKCDIELLRKISPGCRITLSSHFPEQDKQFNIPADEIIGRNPEAETYEEMYADTINCITPDTICLSVGGDNYCYKNWQRYATIHYAAKERGAKSILWSCSLEPSMIDEEMLDVLRTHDLIAARESFTLDTLEKKGVTNCVLAADIAFFLKAEPCNLPKGRYVVLNFSPLIMRKNPEALKFFQLLADNIINNSDLNIALVPHVEVSVDNDYEAMVGIKGDKSRIFHIPTGLSAAQCKHIIANAEACVAARTHVTIASWSASIPTIAVGYSLKARGIAHDLGQDAYILPIETLTGETLCKTYNKLINNSNQIKTVLAERVTECIKRVVPKEALEILK